MLTYRRIVVIFLILTIPMAFAAKFYSGPLSNWVNNSFSSIFYEAFWIFLIIAVRPSLSPAKVAGWVCFITSLLEFLQLWHPPFLQAIRATFVGRAILGTTFSWTDFLYYIAGCLLTWAILASLKRILGDEEQASMVSKQAGRRHA